MSQVDSDESFTYIMNPISSTGECVDRVENSNLPSLSDAMEGGGGRSGSLLIRRDTFVKDTLSGFSKLNSDKVSEPSGEFNPVAVEPRSREQWPSMPEDFLEGKWPHVWMQFVRDISRETLLIDGVLHTNPHDALESLRGFLGKVYDETNTGATRMSKNSTNNDNNNDSTSNMRGGGVASRVIGAVWASWNWAREAHAEMRKRKALTQAIRLAVLTAQQSVLALPVEMLQSQFCRGFEHIIYVGEPRVEKDGEDVDTNPSDDLRRMTIQVGRRERGSRLPFVRLEKHLDAFTLDDDMGGVSTKLQLQVAIEVILLTDDYVELSWKWRTPSR